MPPGATLDTPPPPPAMGGGSPSLQGLAGNAGGQPTAGSSQKVVLEHMMEVEKLLGRIGDIRPNAAPIISDLLQQMRARLGKALMSDSQTASQTGGAPNLAGLVTSGAAPSTPTS